MAQTRDLLRSWHPNSQGEIKTTSDDTRTVALHVLAYVAFQKPYPFGSQSKAVTTGAELTYRDSIAIILENIFLILIFPTSCFTLPGLPVKWKRIGWAVENFRRYMITQVKEEEKLKQNAQPGSGTLVSNLVRGGTRNDTVNPLTEAEILGNIFVFNFAGHDTTAISLAYAVLLLVTDPSVQDWIHEEIREYVKDENLQDLDYSSTFPKLKRCIAVLVSPLSSEFCSMMFHPGLTFSQFETLRLYNPLPGVPKYTGRASTSLDVDGRHYNIPADTLVVPHLQAMHTFPRYWGDDSLEWRPQRWLESTGDLSAESLINPPKGTYFPWSEGARNCPGKKFAQVEFVAVMVGLFRDHMAEPVPRASETMAKARRRALSVVKESNVELLLQMRNPHGLSVRWKTRR